MSSVSVSARVDKMKLAQLRETLQASGLATSGTKSNLVLRLEDAISKDHVLEDYFREAQEEEENGLEWLNAQAATQRRFLEEEEGDEWGRGSNDARLDVVGHLKDFGKKKIAEARESLWQLESEDGRDRARLEYGEVQLDKLGE